MFRSEGWLPLHAGKYKLEFRLATFMGNTAFHREVEVAVPDPHAGSLQISNLMPFSDARMIPPQTGNTKPFSVAGAKFTPLSGQETGLVQGQALKFFYQVWTPSATGALRTAQK